MRRKMKMPHEKRLTRASNSPPSRAVAPLPATMRSSTADAQPRDGVAATATTEDDASRQAAPARLLKPA